jgi:hypothetical protein
VAPRRLALQRFAPNFTRGSASTSLDTKENQMHNANEEAV